MAYGTFRYGDLEVEIGDNASRGHHKSGYNGIWSLKHSSSDRSLFVPTYAGLNHEHIFDGATVGGSNVFFEPRHAAMTFQQTGELEAELHQPPTPTFQLESWSRFRLTAPHYIDLEYRCVARQHVFDFGYIGLFWASYINAPEDKSMYFHGSIAPERPSWMQLCTHRHNDESTVRGHEDKIDLEFLPGYRECLYNNFSPMRFDLPFYYGMFGNHTFIVMFDRSQSIRFSHSPSGGGYNRTLETTNPAWDFQFIVPDYEVNEEYGFKLRVVFREKCTRSDILEEYQQWCKEV